MTAKETRQQIQALLSSHIKHDGIIGPLTTIVWEQLKKAEPESEWPPAEEVFVPSASVIAIVNGPEGQTVIRQDTVGGRVFFIADADVDADGSGGNLHHDPWYQPDTTAKGPDGRALNAEKVPFAVIPLGIKGGYMGCKAKITNIKTGQSTLAVVGDRGPRTKTGELSCEAARRVGLSGNPNTGGTDDRIILYEMWPGIPAMVDGVIYKIQ